MNVTVVDGQGLPLLCETEGCRALASTVWSSASGKQTRACERHNPMRLPVALPLSFHSQTLCHACGQPMRFPVTT